MAEVYVDMYHVNHIGNKSAACEIIRALNENAGAGFVKAHIANLLTENDDTELFALGLKDYLDELIKHSSGALSCGAIVVNCNPFTYGHRYLAEYAAEHSEHLYIFVVSEDKSFFKYEDRFELVRAGTAHLKNVTVLPSGRFLASTITLPSYFGKENIDEGAVDLTLDCGIFARYIAKALNIKKRFVGEEPKCYVTSQYNKSLGEILPKYGVELRVIPRKKIGGEHVSASTVRELLKENAFDKIKKIVPATTYDYLKKNFS
jgi:[citrate (pro-3S)-lyase] ligase